MNELTPARPLRPARPFGVLTEAQWQGQVIHLAELHGWRVMHVRRSKARADRWATTTSISGWPDLFLWHPGQRRTIAAELKSDRGRLEPHQREVLDSLAAAGVETHVWRPRDRAQVIATLRHQPEELRP